MWRYLRAAFFVGVPVPGLGQLPLNAMASFAVAVLGFVEPSVWLAGFGLEVAVLGSLAFNSRFQKVVDARALPLAARAESDRRSALIAALPADLKARLAALHSTSDRILAISRKLAADLDTIAGTEASLDKLQWTFLKLLIARDHLANDLGAEPEQSLRLRIQSLEKELALNVANPSQRSGLQQSQQATLDILTQRLQNLENREHLLKENESDLSRIEALVALMRENAAIEGKPAAVHTEIEFASDLGSVGGSLGLYGTHAPLVRELDDARSGR